MLPPCRSRYRKRACLTQAPELDQAVPRVNDLLAADIPEDRFVTAFVGVVEPAAALCRYISAGQAPILVYRAATEEVTELPTSGLPLSRKNSIKRRASSVLPIRGRGDVTM